MATEIKVPTLGESITEATVITWLKNVGESVAVDELLVELETDKVAMEVPSPVAGVLTQIIADIDADVEVGGVLAIIEEGATAAQVAPTPQVQQQPAAQAAPIAAQAPLAPVPAQSSKVSLLSPAVRKLLEENNLDANVIAATGANGRLTKSDVVNHMNSAVAPAPVVVPPQPQKVAAPPVQAKKLAPAIKP